MLAGTGLIALVLLSLGADRPEGIVLALIAVGVVAFRRRTRGTDDEPEDTARSDEAPVLPAIVAASPVSERPQPVVTIAVLALLQLPVLAGIGATTLVMMDALLSPSGGATPSRVAAVVGILVLVAIPSLVSAVGVWRGSEDARSSLLGLCRLRVGLSALGCLTFFMIATPLALVVLDVHLRYQLEDPLTRRWCALSPAPGPGSPPR